MSDDLKQKLSPIKKNSQEEIIDLIASEDEEDINRESNT